MVEYNPKNWVFLVSHKYSRHIFTQLLPAMIYTGIYTAVIAFLIQRYHVNFQGTPSVHSIMGIVLGFFLVFRTNGAYDRWWEGRKIWGALVNNCRNVAMKFAVMTPKDHPLRALAMEAIATFPTALKEHLRSGVPREEADEMRERMKLDYMPHMPNSIAKKLIWIANTLKKEGTIDAEQYRVLDNEIRSLTDITGMCERIKNTPIPYSYSLFMKKFIFIFIATLPLAFITTYGYWTIAIVVMLLYVLLSIELLAEEIEDPFGSDINDLPTDSLSEKIDGNVRNIMAE